MPDQTTPASQGGSNPRNNPRQHKRPVRRHSSGAVHGGSADASLGATVASSPVVAGGTRPSAPVSVPGAQGTGGQSAASQEAAARAAYERYVAATGRPHPQAATQSHGAAAGHPAASQAPHAGHPQHPSQPTVAPGSYAGYVQPGVGNPRVAPAQKMKGQMSAYSDVSRYKKRGKKKASRIGIVAAVVILAAIGVGAFLYLNPPTFNITVNGMTRTVDQGATVADLVAEGVVSPHPGNLLDVEGAVIEEGGGKPFDGTINGNAFEDTSTELHKGDTVQISDGSDVTEDYDVVTSEVQPGQRELGEGAIHVYVPGEAGQIEQRTGKVSGKTIEGEVKPVQDAIFFQYNASPDEKVLALTFDDGPWPTTTELLDVLKEYDVKATFFTIGEQIADYPEAIQREVAEGHQICTHTWDHAAGSGRGVDLTRMSAEEQVEEVQKGIQAIADATGAEASTIIRAPGGNYHDEIIWTLAPYVTGEMGWNVDTEDWRRPGADAIAERIMSAKSGDIVLMHDGGGKRNQTIEALKIALPYLKEQGFKFVTIDELLAYDDAKELANAAAAAADGTAS